MSAYSQGNIHSQPNAHTLATAGHSVKAFSIGSFVLWHCPVCLTGLPNNGASSVAVPKRISMDAFGRMAKIFVLVMLMAGQHLARVWHRLPEGKLEWVALPVFVSFTFHFFEWT